VETTDPIAIAAEKLLMPAEAPETEEQVEKEAPEQEPTEDAQVDDEAETAEDEADAGDDAETAEDEAGAEEPGEPVFEVKVDGEIRQMTLEELKRSAAGQGYIQKRMQEVAAEKKQVEAIQAQLREREQHVLALAEQFQSGQIAAPPQPPNPDLAQKDPVGYIRAQAKYQSELGEYQSQQARLQAIMAQQAQEAEAQRAAELTANAERLKEAIPDFADPQKAEAIKSSLIRTGRDYGYSDEELLSVTDARAVQVLHDAAQWRKLQATKANPVKQAAPKVVKPGARRAEPPQLARQKIIETAKKTGRLEDFAKAILE
jgi:hypothetical protein